MSDILPGPLPTGQGSPAPLIDVDARLVDFEKAPIDAKIEILRDIDEALREGLALSGRE